ncbi:PadR family transcriptional regulator [Actinomadura pelletieri DSM 43383]|uniref:PadR family transcriptional regulator n=1 Tax=Actinomadura pelletieri DSM 43383 TaxID=1120940 RepID=A0A495QXY0_9ACTN|nr:PadR family transcriptional regulator [Actinomadura pelletieri]RKS78978.1 PadR family transcriptional regulator [Actinomadura pelletieri DSM 43383]
MAINLSASSYLVLGLIGLRGPSSSYQLKRAVERSIGYFWPFPHSQLYVEPKRLAEAGLLEESTETEGRRRRTYSLTPEGREALREWLRDPDTEMFQVRNEAELKLFFSELGDEGTVERLADAQLRYHQGRLDEFQKMLERLVTVPDLEKRVAPLVLGVRIEEACLSFWRDVRETGVRGALGRTGLPGDHEGRHPG